MCKCNNYENQIIELCQKLIQKQSYSGQEENIVNTLKEVYSNDIFDDITIDKYGNIIACIKGKQPGKKILFDAHIDTVPVTNEQDWIYPPFSAEIHDNKIYGRGASDMKGALSAFIIAAKSFCESTNKEFPGEIYIAGVVHEECFEGVASREISKHVKPDYVIIGESSNLNINIGQRGRAEIRIETFGVPCHSSNPSKGVNAVYKMTKLINEINKIEPLKHDTLGEGILVLTDIVSKPYPGASVVPEYCCATYDRRLLVNESKESVLKPINDIIDKLSKEDKDFKAKASFVIKKEQCYTNENIEAERFFPAWLYDENDNYIKEVKSEIQNIGFEPKISIYNFCTNASHYAGEAGIKTFGLGPSVENLAHTTNEYIKIEDLVNVYKCYMASLKALLK